MLKGRLLLNLKPWPGTYSKTRYYARFGYLQVLKYLNKNVESVRAANYVDNDGIWPIHTLMCPDNLHGWKNQMKNEGGARVVTTLYSYILDAEVQLTL